MFSTDVNLDLARNLHRALAALVCKPKDYQHGEAAVSGGATRTVGTF